MTPIPERGGAGLAKDRRVDSLCDAFEDAWRRGERPSVASFLAGAGMESPDPSLTRELARLELELGGDSISHASPLVVPSDFGRFRVTRLLGAGGMGAVYEAFDPRLGRAVALKVMLPGVAARPAARAAFVAEARALAAVGHDHVVAVHEAGEVRGTPYLVMPLLRGETLAARLGREGVLPLAEALRVAEEAAGGLAACHAAGLVHRDVKPGNLWLEAPGGRVKLLDFGLALSADDAACGAAGTPAYASPEQLAGGTVDARSDLFGLGAVLYQALTGRRPFPDGDLGRAMPVPLDLGPGVPGAIANLVVRLLAADPAARPESAAAVARELRVARRPAVAATTRGRRWFVAAALVVAGSGALAALLPLDQGREPVLPAPSPETETDVQDPEAGPAADPPPDAAPVVVAAPRPGSAFNLDFAQLVYNPSPTTSQAIRGMVHVTNPAKVLGTFPASLYWCDRPDPGGRLELAGTRNVVLSKSNPAGGHGFHLSPSELKARPRPPWATHLVAVVNPGQTPAESNNADNVRSVRLP